VPTGEQMAMAKIIEFPKPTIYRVRGRRLRRVQSGKVIPFPESRHEGVSDLNLLKNIVLRIMLATEA